MTADSSPSVPEYNAQASTQTSESVRWPLSLSLDEDEKDSVQLQELDGIHVDREVDVSQP